MLTNYSPGYLKHQIEHHSKWQQTCHQEIEKLQATGAYHEDVEQWQLAHRFHGYFLVNYRAKLLGTHDQED